ncbi:hypothetical protein NO357_13430, partial [Marimonas arenosa]|nr:hypothetical protein [Marimonas arenosa]
MAVYFIYNDSNGYVATANGDIYIIQNNNTLAHTGDAFDIGTYENVTVNVAGSIVAGSDGITSATGSYRALVTIETTGSVTGNGDAISLHGDRNAVTNFGTLAAYNNTGIEIFGNFAEVSNHGAIHAIYGVLVDGDAAEVGNFGSIFALNTGVLLNGASAYLANSGQIQAEDTGVSVRADTGESTYFSNTGTVQGRLASVRGGFSNDTVINSGTLIGDVRLGAGNDSFDNRGGTVVGDVFGGAGNDTYITDSAALQIVEFAGEGTDEVRSTVRYILGDNLENLT